MRFGSVWMVMALALGGCVASTDSDLTAEQRESRVRSHTTLAMGYINNGNFDRAVEPLKRALELDAADPEAMLAQAALLERQGDTALAGDAYRRLLSVNADFTRGRQNYAAFLFKQNQLDAACAEFDAVVADTLYVNRAQAFENLGVCRLRMDQIAPAVVAFERAYGLDGSRPLPSLELASAKYDQGDVQSAAFYYRAFLGDSRPNARSLWLGIRIADAIGDRNSQGSYELLLRNEFANSPEYQAWTEWKP
ncbi:type IV pilus biogenesis/stability protein PilW [Litorivicinus lipolyticus]|uniref:Type IV pilus biogenesis/stability protein PilW n=1 Tax=Litorivicinus lipolyticus TaxID=418701 RepID=A0A5Q2Q697_9GAMM|nr:type IV pilus biogenesis/stability protein PilW [Litorivicinus lipolyticus]QGG79719.1 type IV pilus biogenesis/stability protein PilW [Litorivicinus lipolyticus]